MKTETYPALAQDLSDNFVLTRLNRDDNDSHIRYREARFTPLRLAQKLGANGVPAVIFLAPSGRKLMHIAGFLEANDLRPAVRYVSRGAYRQQSREASDGN